MTTIGIVDYGANLLSVEHAVRHVGATPVLLQTPADFGQVDRIILRRTFGAAVGALSRAWSALWEPPWNRANPCSSAWACRCCSTTAGISHHEGLGLMCRRARAHAAVRCPGHRLVPTARGAEGAAGLLLCQLVHGGAGRSVRHVPEHRLPGRHHLCRRPARRCHGLSVSPGKKRPGWPRSPGQVLPPWAYRAVMPVRAQGRAALQ